MWTDADHRTKHTPRCVSWLLAALLLASTAHVRALSTDSDQPIAIQADRAEHDDARHITVYRGNVVIDQGTLHITGDTVTIQFDTQDDVTKITATGAPAHFRQWFDGDTDHRKAWANRMEYFPEQGLVVLIDEARYEKDGNHVQADRLVYDSLKSRFKALTDSAGTLEDEDGQTAAKKPERVRIQIKPKKDPKQ